MAKRVVYNGGTESYKGADDPSILKKGKIYEVIREEDLGWQTNYTLKGVEGEFNSLWFDKPEYFAIANTIPIVGKSIEVTLVGDTRTLMMTPPMIVTEVGQTVFRVETKNSVYFVKVQ